MMCPRSPNNILVVWSQSQLSFSSVTNHLQSPLGHPPNHKTPAVEVSENTAFPRGSSHSPSPSHLVAATML